MTSSCLIKKAKNDTDDNLFTRFEIAVFPEKCPVPFDPPTGRAFVLFVDIVQTLS